MGTDDPRSALEEEDERLRRTLATPVTTIQSPANVNQFEANAGRRTDLRAFLQSVMSLIRDSAGCRSVELLEAIEHARPPERLPRQPTVSFVSMISGLLVAGELVLIDDDNESSSRLKM